MKYVLLLALTLAAPASLAQGVARDAVLRAVVVSRALGHANIQQAARYSHLSDDTQLAAADAAANALGEKWTEGKKSPA